MKPSNINQMIRRLLLFIIAIFQCYFSMAQDSLPNQRLNLPQDLLKMKYRPSDNVKWSMFGLNRVHVQDFGITDLYTDTCNCGETRPFFDKSNVNIGVGLYHNISNKLAFSGDLSFGYGYVSKKKPTLEDKKQAWLNTLHADL